jgi:hypothetical protein
MELLLEEPFEPEEPGGRKATEKLNGEQMEQG